MDNKIKLNDVLNPLFLSWLSGFVSAIVLVLLVPYATGILTDVPFKPTKNIGVSTVNACNSYYGENNWTVRNVDIIDFDANFIRANPNLFYSELDDKGRFWSYACMRGGQKNK